MSYSFDLREVETEPDDEVAISLNGVPARPSLFRRTLGIATLGDTTLTDAWRDQILADINATSAKAQAVENFKSAHPFDLADAIGAANLANWNNFWDLADSQSAAVFNLYEKLAGDKNNGVSSSWSSQEEGAFSGWKYAVEQLYAIANAPPVQPPVPTPTPTPAPKPTPTPAAGLSTLAYVGIGVGALGLLGGVAYLISR